MSAKMKKINIYILITSDMLGTVSSTLKTWLYLILLTTSVLKKFPITVYCQYCFSIGFRCTAS